jgi:hypothetical protein
VTLATSILSSCAGFDHDTVWDGHDRTTASITLVKQGMIPVVMAIPPIKLMQNFLILWWHVFLMDEEDEGRRQTGRPGEEYERHQERGGPTAAWKAVRLRCSNLLMVSTRGHPWVFPVA